jgi:hypothetical protein
VGIGAKTLAALAVAVATHPVAGPPPTPAPIPMLNPERPRPGVRPLAAAAGDAAPTAEVCRLARTVSDLYAGRIGLIEEEVALVEDAWRVLDLCAAEDGGSSP